MRNERQGQKWLCPNPSLGSENPYIGPFQKWVAANLMSFDIEFSCFVIIF